MAKPWPCCTIPVLPEASPERLVKLPFYNPGHRGLSISLLLILLLILLLFTGLGVFRLYFGFEWTAGNDLSGQLFTLDVRGGQSFNLFEVEDYGRTFWSSLLLLFLLCVLMPLFRIAGAAILATLCGLALVAARLHYNESSPLIPLEFELLIVVLLFVLYVLLCYFAEVRDRKRSQQLLSQYVPAELARAFQRDPQALAVSGAQRDITVLFCDVVGFTAITQQLSPPQLAQWLNLLFTHVSRIVVRYRGSVDKYMGDSVMAVWGALTPSQTHAHDALCAGMDILEELAELNALYRDRGLPSVTLSIGISTGSAMVGPLGSEYRMDYTVVGDSVNVAQRLETLTRQYGVGLIVSDRTAAELPEMVFRELDTVAVKGRTELITMHEPIGRRDTLSPQTLKHVALHEQAMRASHERDWDTAVSLFSRLRDEWGPTSMYEFYLRGIELARQA